MKTILVPIDFSPVTREVLAEAAALAREFGGRIVLLNVTKPSSVLRDHDAFLDTIAGLDRSGTVDRTGRQYTSEGDPDHRPVPGDSVQLIGDPVTVILQQAVQVRADYIVMGSHGHSTLYDYVMGSVAAGVVKGAECPVMLVPPRERRARIRGTGEARREPLRPPVKTPVDSRPGRQATRRSRGAGSRL